MTEEVKTYAESVDFFPPGPETERGWGIHLSGSTKGQGKGKYLYCHGTHVYIRSLEDPTVCTVFSEHKSRVTVARFSPGGNWIASGDASGKLYIWECDYMMVKIIVEVNNEICDICWSMDGKRVCAVGQGDKDKCRVFAWDTGTSIGKIIGHSKRVLACDFKPTRPFRIVTGGEDMSVNMHEGPPFKYKGAMKKHTRYCNSVRFSPDGNAILSVGADYKMIVMDAKTGEFVREIKAKDGHKGSIYDFCWSADSKKILTVSSDKSAKIWDFESGTVEKTWTMGKDIQDFQVGCIWIADKIATVSLSGAINYLDMDNPGAPSRTLYATQATVRSIVCDPSTNSFFAAGNDARITKFDVTTQEGQWYTGNAKKHAKTISALGLTADGKTLVSTSFDDKMFFNDANCNWGDVEVVLGGQPVAVSRGPTAGDFAVVLTQGTLLIANSSGIASSISLNYQPMDVSWSPCGSKIAVAGKDKKVHVYACEGSTVTDKKAQHLSEHTRPVTFVLYSPQGLLCSIGQDRNIYFWDNEGEQLNFSGWQYHTSTITAAAWSPSGKYLATAGDKILLWDNFEQLSKKSRQKLAANKEGVTAMAFYDDYTLITAGGDHGIMKHNLPK